MHKVITGTVFAVAALATTAAFAESAKAPQAQPTVIERIFSGLTDTGVKSKNAAKVSKNSHSSGLSASERVRLSGYAPTGKPELDNWVRSLRSFRTDGPNGG